METIANDAAVLRRADDAYSAGQWEQALRAYAVLLNADPEDLYVWHRTAAALGHMGDRATAVGSLETACTALAESGQLWLALAAAAELASFDQARAARRLDGIAALYGRGSRRLADVPRSPPPVPAATAAAVEAQADVDPPQLKRLAARACQQALERAVQADRHDLPLPAHPLVSELAPQDLVELLPLLQLRSLPSGTVVIEQGAEGASMFVIVRGRVEVSRDGVHLAHMRSGGFFGEMALLTRSQRTAQVVTRTPVLLFELDRTALEQLATRSAAVAQVLAEHTRNRLLRGLMATSPLFRPLDPQRRADLIELFTSRVFEAGETVVREGTDADGLHVVLSGAVRVVKTEEGDRITLADLGPGQVFGEISMIQQRPATASVIATEKVVVLRLSRDAFNEHVANYPEVLAHVYKLAVERDKANLELTQAPQVLLDDEDAALI